MTHLYFSNDGFPYVVRGGQSEWLPVLRDPGGMFFVHEGVRTEWISAAPGVLQPKVTAKRRLGEGKGWKVWAWVLLVGNSFNLIELLNKPTSVGAQLWGTAFGIVMAAGALRGKRWGQVGIVGLAFVGVLVVVVAVIIAIWN